MTSPSNVHPIRPPRPATAVTVELVDLIGEQLGLLRQLADRITDIAHRPVGELNRDNLAELGRVLGLTADGLHRSIFGEELDR